MSDLNGLIERYFAIWNEPDPARRDELIGRTWSDDASYLDPMLSAEGPDGIQTMVASVQEQFPGHRFRRVSEIDSHHDRLRFAWELVNPASAPVVRGSDYGLLAPDGRLRAITGFFEQPVAPAETP